MREPTVGDELAFDSLPEEVKALAKRVLSAAEDEAYDAGFSEGRDLGYDSGYDSGFEEGYGRGCKEEKAKTREEIEDLEERVERLQNEIDLLKLPPLP